MAFILGSRCARCCQSNHHARRCRHGNPELWNNRYLTDLDKVRVSLRVQYGLYVYMLVIFHKSSYWNGID